MHVTQPNNKAMPFAQYNAAFQSNLTVDPTLENKVKGFIQRAKAQFGPNEVVPMSYFAPLLSSCKKDKDGKVILGKKLPAKTKQSLSEALKQQTNEKADGILFASLTEEADSVKCNVCQEEKCSGHAEDIEFEDEYEESDVVPDVKAFLAQSLSGDDLTQAHNHVIYFNRKNVAMGDKLMKGKDRYMKALRMYVKGDNTVEVRLMSKAKVKVADLNLNRDSLTALLRLSPGKPRICECNA